MKYTTRMLSFILVLCCMINTTVLASSTENDFLVNDHNAQVLDSGKCGENLTWTLYSDGLLHITGTGRAYDYCKGILIGRSREEIESQMKSGTIPADYAFQEGKQYDDENGQYVSPWYKYRSEVDFSGYTSESAYNRENPEGWKYNRIQIDPGITYIGDWMFYRVSGPTELIIPEGVTRIGRWGIRYSPTLKSVVLPNSLTDIEYRGLSRNEVMTNISFGNKLTTIGDYGLAQNHSITKIELPDSVVTIGINLFEGCDELATVRMGNVKKIPSRTFVSLNCLEDVIIPESVTSIGEYAFYNCASLKSIVIPSKVTSISANAFYMCENLHDVYINSQAVSNLITSKNSCAYLISYAKRAYIKDGITSPFFEKGWEYIETVDGYKRYNSYAYIEDDNVIKSGYIGATVYYILRKTEIDGEYELTINGSGALTSTTYKATPWYTYKDNIVSVCIGGITNIPANCFYEYANLRTAVVSCEKIPNNMFYKCLSLKNVDLTGVKTIGDYAFYTTALTEIVIPDGVTTIGNNSFGSISVASSVTIGKDVTNIASNAFASHKGNVIIPADNSIVSIGGNAFAKSQGTGTLNLPKIETIGNKAFQFGNSFTCINIGPYIDTIGTQAFEYNEKAIVTVDKDETFITIGQNAFRKTPENNLIFNANIAGNENTKIDYDNHLIFTNVSASDTPEDIILFSENILVLSVPSYQSGNTEFCGTGSEFYVFVGDEYKGKYKIVVSGDLNGDSVCDALDAMYAERVSTGNMTASTIQVYAANGCVSDDLSVSSYQNVVNLALSN